MGNDGLKIAVAMSGGVDSSTAALILKQQGHEVTGYTMILGIVPELDRSAVESAKAAAVKIGISHRTVDLSKDFEDEVIRYFMNEYKKGKTPNPCALCNRFIKFGGLVNRALSDGNDFFATGHYARIENGPPPDELVLKRGIYKEKDQSYFLFYLPKEILKKIIFPLGEMSKPETFKIAERAGLRFRERPESADACFLDKTDYRTFLKEHGVTEQPGEILYLDGTTLGKHNGLQNYTIGQRKGMGIAFKEPLYVIKIDAANNTLIVGREEHIYTKSLKAEDVNILYTAPGRDFDCSVKIRYRHKPAPAHVILDSKGGAEIEFETPQRAVTPGQAAVFYRDDILIGGGWII